MSLRLQLKPWYVPTIPPSEKKNLSKQELLFLARICSQLVDPLSFAALGENNTLFRDSSFTSLFNPTNSTPPFFQVFDPSFLTSIIGPNATIRSVASNATFSFAHEAPIWNPETNVVTFASNDGGALGMSDLDHNSKVGQINMTEVESALVNANGTEAVEVTVTEVGIPEFQAG